MEFQSYAYQKNHYTLDPDLKPVLQRFWPEFTHHEPQLAEFGALAGGRAYQVADWVDRTARPELVAHDLDGRRVDRARLSPSHRSLLEELAFINQPPYRGSTWQHHYALGYLLADTGLYCTLIVTNQTAYAIYKYAPHLDEWLERLLTGQAWGATWMSESHAGSDLGANLTTARKDGDVWRLSGDDKYFASNAGIADMAVVTARPEGAPAGAKGLALFLVPRLDEDGRLNYHIRRFKNKSATRAVPTGEAEFEDALAYPVGDPALGIYYTLENLTVSRLANAAGAMGMGHKAHLEAAFRVRARSAFGALLHEHPLIRRDLTDLAVRMAGGVCLLFYGVRAFDRAWKDTPPYTPAYHYARFLSHIVKNRTADHAIYITQLASELFGGLGFMDDYAVSRLHREALVTSIWEGGSNLQALDMLEAIAKKQAHEPFYDEIVPMLNHAGTPAAVHALHELNQTMSRLSTLSSQEAQWYAKDALTTLADVAQVALLYNVAQTGGERYAKIAELYTAHFLQKQPYPAWALSTKDVWFPFPDDIFE